MKKSSINTIVNKWLFFVLIAFSVVACDSGNKRDKAPEFIGMINVELKDVSLLNSGIFQLYIDGKFDAKVNSTCIVSHVQPSDAGLLDCSAVTYDENTTTLNITMSFGGGTDNGSLTLDFTDGTKVIATLTDGVTIDSGGAVLVSPALVSRSVVTFAGDKYTDLSLLNPPMGFDTAEITDSNANTVATLWNNDYSALYQSYLRSDSNDGIAQGSLTYVSQKGVPIEPLLPPETYGALLPPETYTVNFLPLPAADSKEYKVTIAAATADVTKPLDPITLFKDKPPTDPVTVPAEKELPPIASEFNIEIAGVATSLAGAETFGAALDVGEGPYKFSWRNTLAAPTTDKWQVTFHTVDNVTGARIQHQQKRTNRILANGVSGPVYTVATVEPDITTDREWSWLLPADMTFNAGDVVEVEFRASDFSNTLNGIAQSFYITKP